MSDETEAEADVEDADADEKVQDEPAAEEAAAEESDGSEEGADADGLEEGNFVRLAYTARTVEEDQLVDTTDPEVAEEADVDDQGQEFEPRIVVLGAGHIFDAVEADILGKGPGEEGSVVVPAGEAFGEYDPDEVRTVSADKIPEDSRYPGAHVDVDGQHGHVETIIGGRARVDFNHPLAGDDIEYEYEILEVVEDREEQAAGLIDAFLDVDLDVWFQTDEVEEEQLVEPEEDEEADEGDEEAGEDEDADEEPAEPEFETVTVEKESLYIEATPQLSMNQQWMFGKQQIAQQLIDRLGIDRVVVQETIDGMGGMMGGMGGMMGGAGGGDLEAALEDADVDAEEIAEELDLEADEEGEAPEAGNE